MSELSYITHTKVGTGEERWYKDIGAVRLSELFDLVYPVGSYYETSDTNFDPNTSFGGVWVLENEGHVHVSAGLNHTVVGASDDGGKGLKDGGNRDAIIPHHRHHVNAFNSGGSSPGTNSAGNHSHNTSLWNLFKSPIGTGPRSITAMVTETGAKAYDSSGNGSHSHTVNNHTHSIGAHDTDYVGTSGNTVDANMQPYINVNRWHRTA